jgi:RNA recognition motif-containing protein
MAKRLFVGGLPWAVNDQKLEEIFSQYGKVTYSKVITDKYSGRSKGFGFIEFETDEEADKATKALNGTDMEGRKIAVNEARPMEPRPSYNNNKGGYNKGGNKY